jgi:hypothetical protein
MARQRGAIKLTGLLGGISFYKSQDGYLAREKGGVSAERIESDPAFARTRENNNEFGNASLGSKIIRDAVKNTGGFAMDNRVAARLTAKCMEVVHSDTTSARGFRNMVDGDDELLEGFEFNVRSQLPTRFTGQASETIDRVTGKLDVALDPYIPVNAIAAPAGTTHFKIVSAGLEVDFATGLVTADAQSSAMIAYDATATAALTLSNTVTANSTKVLILCWGIEFYQEVNGSQYVLNNGAYNSYQIVAVSQV